MFQKGNQYWKLRKKTVVTHKFGKGNNIRNTGRTRFKKGMTAWNKGLTKEADERVRKLGEKTGKTRIRNGLAKLQKNSSWLGGISFEPYDKTFNNKFKRAIRKRDNQICMLCGVHREKLNEALTIHHANYDKKLTIPQNCLSLCRSCNSKVNFNRKHWTKFFQSLLSERYGYQYNNQEIILNMEKTL